MDFIMVLKAFKQGCRQKDIQHALLGGAALAAYGLQRSTLDLDFLVLAEDLPKLDQLLGGLGYRLEFRSENVSHFRHARSAWGSLDFLHAFRQPSLEALSRAKATKIYGALSVKALIPEDIIGFKVQAMINDPSRKARDLADIDGICKELGSELDWELVRSYFKLFKMATLGRRLEARYGKG